MLAYSDPASSPVSYQLNPVQREPVCTALNSAILGKPLSCLILLSVSLTDNDNESDFIYTLAGKRPDSRTKLCDAVVKQFNVTICTQYKKNTET